MSQFPYRSVLKHFVCFIAIVFFSANIFAQQPKPVYDLLWRISGHGLSQPSYVFGTMHVKDKRVFHFSDSLMLAIQKSKAFALEVHPDSLMTGLFNIMQKGDSSLNLRKLLNEKEYAEVAKKFEEKNGYKMRDDINPLLAESMLKNDKSKPGDYDSFLDAYLYGIARTMDKNIYGLENTSQQLKKEIGSSNDIKERLLNLLGEGEGEDDSEEMIQIYSTGNLDNIWNYVQQYDLTNLELIARNKVMVASIINDSRNGSLFAAVGAAHLPGEDGIISLLRKQGYTVEPVQAKFTGVANKYHIDYDNMKWVTHTDYEMGYSIDFPSEPIKTDIYANLTTWIYPDIANENFYGIYVLPKGTKSDPANREKVIEKIIQNFAKNRKDKIISRKNGIINGLPCTDVIVKNSFGYQRSVLIVNNNILYYMYMGKRLSSLHSVYANRFFNSFKGFKLTEKPAKEWIIFKNDTGAFSVKLPFHPYRVNREVPNPSKGGSPFKMNMFVASDTVGLLNYLIRYNDYPSGTYLANKNAIFDKLSSEFSGKGKIIGAPKTIWKNGYEGREINVIFNGGYHSVIQVYIRGNRLFVLLKQNLHEDEKVDSNDPFFNSFTLTPYIPITYVTFESKDGNFKIKLASNPKIVNDTIHNTKSYIKDWTEYITTSPTSGGVFTLEHLYISKYFRTTHIDSLYEELNKLLVNKYTDTLIKSDTVRINGKKAKEIIVENRDTHDQKRYRVLIDEGDIFAFQGHVAKDELFNDESNVFYSSFERTGPATKANIFVSKADRITTDLLSADTTIQKEALGALSYYKFSTNELPYVYSALQKPYTDDTISYGTRYKLIGVFNDVHDERTIDELQKLYYTLQGKNSLKTEVLRTIPTIDPKKTYDIYFNLLVTDTAAHPKKGYGTFRPLYDSLKYAADHFHQLIPLIPNPAYRDDILTLSERLLEEKNETYQKLVKDNFKPLTAYAMDELNTFLASKDTNKTEWSTNIYKYLTLMGGVKGEPLTNKFTSYYIAHNAKSYGISNAVIARINNHLPTGTILMNKLMDSMYTRYDIMQALYKQKQADKIPAKYKIQQEFARLCFYQYLNSNEDDDKGTPLNIKLMGSVTDKGALYYAFKYNLTEQDSDKTYIGIAGPYKPGSAVLNFEKYNAYTNYDIKENNWIKQAKKLIPDLIKAHK